MTPHARAFWCKVGGYVGGMLSMGALLVTIWAVLEFLGP